MTVRLAINGFGRIGRLVFRALQESGRTDVEIVAINDLAPVETHAYLLKYDSVHGAFKGKVEADSDGLLVDGKLVKVVAEPKPENLPWGDLGIDIVLECSGRFASKEASMAHINAGCKKVIVSAPATNADLTVVYGVNHEKLTADHQVISNASCTTNCLAPVAHILQKVCGIERGYMTTIHAYTGDQRIVDTMHSDLRRARAAALSMIPTSTGAARAVGLVLPELKGKLDGSAVRVPVANVSLVDLKFDAAKAVSTDEINESMQQAAANELKGVLSFNTEELVSVDFNHSAYSSNFDATQTQVIDGKFVRVLSWYDNEWGFSNRMLDTAAAFAKVM